MHLSARLLYVLISLVLVGHQAWSKESDPAERQSQAEREQTALRERIKILQQEIDAREVVRKEAADALKASESAISVSGRRIAELNLQLKAAQAQLELLQTQIRQLQGSMAVRLDELSNQLRKQYTSGLSPWAALLSGDEPQKLGRDLAYLDFVSRARVQNLTTLKKEIDRLADLQARADASQQDISRVVRENTEQHRLLDAQKKERATILARLEGQIRAQRVEATRMGLDDKRLTDLIDGLSEQLIAARKAAEVARQAEDARRVEQARRTALERQALEARRSQEARQAADAARLAAAQARQALADQRAEAQAHSLDAEKEAAQARQAAAEAARQARSAGAAYWCPRKTR